MPQVAPTYQAAAGKPEAALVNAIVNKYGAQALSWPVVLSNDDQTLAYLYERNATNQTNVQGDARPPSASGLPSYFLDYTSAPRVISPPDTDLWQLLLAPGYSDSYQFSKTQSHGYFTVDLDYVWHTGTGFKGFEFTTFTKPFFSEAEAQRLAATIQKRPTAGRALPKILAAANDLGIDFQMVVANSVGGPGTPVDTNGNVLYFPLTAQQINLLMAGQQPVNAVFCSFQNFVQQL